MGTHPLAILLFLAVVAVGFIGGTAAGNLWVTVGVVAAGLLLSIAIRVAQQWQKAVVLRLGRFHRLQGPGFFLIVPVFDAISHWIDLRTITTPFAAERTLTKDSVPVDVDAVLFWRVIDPMKAAP